MQEEYEKLMKSTVVVQSPQQRIFTFWETRFQYYVLCRRKTPDKELSESPMALKSYEGNVASFTLRKGELICSKPKIVLPDQANDLFKGFSSEADDFAQGHFEEDYRQLSSLGYTFENHLIDKKNINENKQDILNKLAHENAKKLDVAILLASEKHWSLSLLKLAFEAVNNSYRTNVVDLQERGYFRSEREQQESEIELLFEDAELHKEVISELGEKLQEFNLFEQYEDRFFRLVNSK